MRLAQRIRYAKPVAFAIFRNRLKKMGFDHHTYRGTQIESHYRSHDPKIDRRVLDGEFSKMHVFSLPVAEAFQRRHSDRPRSGFETPQEEARYQNELVGHAHAFLLARDAARNHVKPLVFSWGQGPSEFFNHESEDGIKLPSRVGNLDRLPDHYHVIILEGKDPKTVRRQREQRESARQGTAGRKSRIQGLKKLIGRIRWSGRNSKR